MMLARIILTHQVLQVSVALFISLFTDSMNSQNLFISIGLKEVDNDISKFNEESKLDNMVIFNKIII